MSGPSLLAKYLRDNDLTASAFAAKAGVDNTVVSRAISRTRGVGILVATKIATATNGAVPVDSWIKKPRRSRRAA